MQKLDLGQVFASIVNTGIEGRQRLQIPEFLSSLEPAMAYSYPKEATFGSATNVTPLGDHKGSAQPTNKPTDLSESPGPQRPRCFYIHRRLSPLILEPRYVASVIPRFSSHAFILWSMIHSKVQLVSKSQYIYIIYV